MCYPTATQGIFHFETIVGEISALKQIPQLYNTNKDICISKYICISLGDIVDF